MDEKRLREERRRGCRQNDTRFLRRPVSCVDACGETPGRYRKKQKHLSLAFDQNLADITIWPNLYAAGNQRLRVDVNNYAPQTL